MGSEIHSFRDLTVWQKAMTLVEEVYGISKHFPADERYGLTSQLRRASVSVPSNIAEGLCTEIEKMLVSLIAKLRSTAQG